MSVAKAAIPASARRFVAVAKAAIPASARRFAAVAAANTLIYAGYAMLWVLNACGVFSVVGRRALGEGSPALSAASTVGVYALLGCGCLLPFSLTLVILRTVASLSNSNNTHAKERTKKPAVKGPRQILREILQDAVMVGVLVTFPFLLLVIVGALMRDISPVKESRREWIGSVLLDVGLLGGSAVHCFFILPITVLRTWRLKY